MKRIIVIFWICFLCINVFAQTFSYTDETGCDYKFRILSQGTGEVSLVEATNNRHADLIIPGTINHKGVEYILVKVETESLKKCDTSLRKLAFPSSVREMEGLLFGSAMKLMGGYTGAMSGGSKEGPMSSITLESLKIPKEVKEMGTGTFFTALSTSGSKGIKAHINELPSFILPMNAESYGLSQGAVRDYWERTDPNQLSPIAGELASISQIEGSIRQMTPDQKKAMLKVLAWNNEKSQMIIDSYAQYGLSRADLIALLNGQELPNKTSLAQQVQQTVSPSVLSSPSIPQQPLGMVKTNTPSSDVDLNIPTNAADNENTFAVIFANENYQEEVKVDYALNDGEMFKTYCGKVLGLPETNIHIRKDATLNNMRAEMSWMQQVAKAYKGSARFIVYYAGHGIPDEKSGVSYLLPVDGKGTMLDTGYSLALFYKQLGQLQATNVMVFMDACFSGSKRGEGMLASARGVAIKAKPQAPQGNMVVFSAAQGDETAYPYKEKGHGLFTYYLLKKLKETGGNVTYGELGTYIEEEVTRKSIVSNGKSQTPTVIPSQSLSGSWQTMKLR